MQRDRFPLSRCHGRRVLSVLAACLVGTLSQTSLAQVNCDDPFAEHGAGATKACNNRCLGETMSCTSTFFNLDGFADSLQLMEAFDTVDGSIRVPAVGNLPIIAVLGNAACTNSGGVCNPATGANCALPCIVCTAGTGDSHGGLTCPGLLQSGAVRVRQNTHVITHTGSTTDVISFVYSDNCDSGCSNCPTSQLTTPAASNTVVPDCDDDDPCTIDCCEGAVCSHPSTCVGATCRDVNGDVTNFPPLVCNDNNACTTNTCDDTNPPSCCEFTPIICPPPDQCFTRDVCDPLSGCPAQVSFCDDPPPGFTCDDSDACTTDSCDDANPPSCCQHNPITCPPPDECFTRGPCDPATGCPNQVSFCDDAPPGFTCDDNNACTTDACADSNPPSCCTHTPIECPPPPVCFNQGPCDPAGGCPAPTSVCDDPTFSCDDGDPDTVDTCDDTATGSGCCVHREIPRGGCRITAGRTNRDGRPDLDPFDDILRGQGGGQVGAPCGCIGCFDTFDHIQGNWQYSRKSKKGTFHAKDYNSLICGCDTTSPSCEDTTVAGAGFNNPINFQQGELCNPDDPVPGPEPRPAPANIACFSGLGDWTATNGRKTQTVAFRVEVEDRGEPSVGGNADDTCDVHRIRIWIPGAGEDARTLADGACCTNAVPTGAASRAPDIDDGGNLVHGNIQIHPLLPHSRDGVCPVPDGVCQE